MAGDAYVAATLEVLIEEPSLFDGALDPRVALYRIFVGLWDSIDINLKAEAAADPQARWTASLTIRLPHCRAKPSCFRR